MVNYFSGIETQVERKTMKFITVMTYPYVE